jgi:hypothetical protein
MHGSRAVYCRTLVPRLSNEFVPECLAPHLKDVLIHLLARPSAVHRITPRRMGFDGSRLGDTPPAAHLEKSRDFQATALIFRVADRVGALG